MENFDRRFLTLVLEIEKHIEGYVDAYIGPETLRDEVMGQPRREPADLLEDALWLRENLPAASASRRTFLVTLVRATETTVRILNGETIPYMEEVQRLYDIMPQRIEDTRFEAAHRELDTLLPGSGSLATRLQQRRAHYELPNDRITPLLELARDETRQRTKAFLELPARESVDLQLTTNQPWGAYNWFKGNGRSLIEFNTDVPLSALELLSTFAHEGYPGHHTEGILREEYFWHWRGYGEAAAALLHSPAAVISEAIATTALEVIFPDGTDADWTHDVLLPAAGIAAYEDADQLRRIKTARELLRYVGGNAAILFHTGRLTEDDALDYLQTYALASPERAAKQFSFITHPLFRTYIFTYTEGYDLIASAARGQNKQQVLVRCLTEQITPSQLAAADTSLLDESA